MAAMLLVLLQASAVWQAVEATLPRPMGTAAGAAATIMGRAQPAAEPPVASTRTAVSFGGSTPQSLRPWSPWVSWPSRILSRECRAECEIDGEVVACSDRVQLAAQHTFGKRPGSCAKAYKLVHAECSPCRKCEEDQMACVDGRRSQAQPPSETTTTEAPTTTFLDNCDTVCSLNGEGATCKERMTWLATHTMQNDPHPALVAYNTVLQTCPGCTGCDIGRIIDELARQGAPDDGTDNAGQRKRSEWGCEIFCVLGGEFATCKERVSWLVRHTPNSPHEAYGEVVESCPSCDRCVFAAVNESTPPPPTTTTTTVTTLPFDCEMNVAWVDRWDIRKKVWCCAARGRGCFQTTSTTTTATWTTTSVTETRSVRHRVVVAQKYAHRAEFEVPEEKTSSPGGQQEQEQVGFELFATGLAVGGIMAAVSMASCFALRWRLGWNSALRSLGRGSRSGPEYMELRQVCMKNSADDDDEIEGFT